MEETVNVLAFGLPGVGKTHAVAALGHPLIDVGIAVYFTPTFRLVQELLKQKGLRIAPSSEAPGEV